MSSPHFFGLDLKNPFLYLKSFFKKNPWLFLLLVLGLTLPVCGLTFFLGQEIHSFFNADSPRHQKTSFCILTLTIALLGCFVFAQTHVVSRIVKKVEHSLRTHVFSHLLSLEEIFFKDHSPQLLSSLLIKNPHRFGFNLINTFASFVQWSVIFVGSFFFIASTSIMLASLQGLILLLFLCSYWFWMHWKMSKEDLAPAQTFFEESFKNTGTIHAFNHEKFLHEALQSIPADLSLENKRKLFDNFPVFIVTFLTAGWLATFFSFGPPYEQHLGLLFFSILMSISAVGASGLLIRLQEAREALEPLVDILDHTPLLSSAPLRTLPKPRGILAFHKVSFVDPQNSDSITVKQVTFSLVPGERLAIVGHPGSGQKTLFSLLLGFHKPQSGHIYLDGIDTQEASLEQIRERVGFIPADVPLFTGALYDNISFGNPNASEEEVLNAVQQSGISSFLPDLPDKLDTMMGGKGFHLSLTQKQKVGMARVILRKPSVLLIEEIPQDEYTSNQPMDDSLKRLVNTRTSLIIAQRLSTILQADRVLLLSQGRVEDIGTHSELVGRNAFYRYLTTSQFSEALQKKSA